jgi:hypothetical protein
MNKNMKFTDSDLKAMQSDLNRWMEIDFTLYELSNILKQNKNGLADAIWKDFETVGHPKISLDTAVRDILFDLIANTFAEQNWPLNHEGQNAYDKFFEKFSVSLVEAGII